MMHSKRRRVPAGPHGRPLDEKTDAFAKGGSGARADDAAAAAPGDIGPDCDRRERQDQLLDEGVEETFPASDPVAVKRIT